MDYFKRLFRPKVLPQTTISQESENNMLDQS